MQSYRLARDLATIGAFIILSASAFPREPAGNVTDARVAADTSGDGWLVKGGSYAQQQFSPLREITDKNVGNTGLRLGNGVQEPMGLVAEPMVVDGIIYLSAPRSIVYAIDAATGKVIWTFDPKVRLDFGVESSSSARANRGVAVWAGKCMSGPAMAVSSRSTLQRVDRSGRARCAIRSQSGVTGAPRVARGKVFIGYSGADEHVRGLARSLRRRNRQGAVAILDRPRRSHEGFESKSVESGREDLVGIGLLEAGRRDCLGTRSPSMPRRDSFCSARRNRSAMRVPPDSNRPLGRNYSRAALWPFVPTAANTCGTTRRVPRSARPRTSTSRSPILQSTARRGMLR